MSWRHQVKAGIVLAVLLLVFVAIPGKQTLLTRPLADWMGAQAEQPVVVEAVSPAPKLPPAADPFRAQHQPRTEQTTAVSDPADQLAQAESQPDSLLPASQEETATSTDVRQAKLIDQEPADPITPQAQLAELLTVGGELVEDGVSLPQLVATWRLEDVELLVSRGYGLVVAEWAGVLYHVAPSHASFLENPMFIPLTTRRQTTISNRAVNLNIVRSGSSWKGTSLRPAFTQLEQRLALRPQSSGDSPPVFSFFPTAAFDSYLSRKQFGAVAAVGVDLRDARLDPSQFATIGEVVVTRQRPVYLIRQVRHEDQGWTWQDPEATLLAAGE